MTAPRPPDSNRPHAATFSVDYPTGERARRVERSLRPEVGAIDDERSAAYVSRRGATLELRVDADDLVALRAGMNTWLRLLRIAEDVGRLVDGPTDGAGGDSLPVED